ncbi:MAG: putative lipid II flippase FtsW [Deltaproteobacteria bacterium]|nr:putative lipid II flippase FtsW [Deltaproteobacteria bacterium]
MLGSAIFLLSLGTVMIYSASAVRAFSQHGDGTRYLLQHLVSVLVGLVLLAVVLRVPSEWWSRFAYPMLAVVILALIAVLVPGVGRKANGAARWLALGPVSFQPSEVAKLAIVVYLAHSLARKRERVSSFSIGFVPHVVVTSVLVGLIILEPDLGTGVVIYATLGLMLFAAGTRVGYLVLTIVVAVPVAYHYVATHPHAAARLTVFMNPEAYKHDIGYQVWESIVAFGSGGWTGLGLGAGQQKLYFLPESHTDFIFSVIGQELGFVGVVPVIAAYAILVGRGLWLSSKMTCRFPMFLAFGLSSWMGIQAFTNMAVALALLPTKGMTLPLVSFGRSSIVVMLVGVGILLRLYAEARAVEGVKT